MRSIIGSSRNYRSNACSQTRLLPCTAIGISMTEKLPAPVIENVPTTPGVNTPDRVGMRQTILQTQENMAQAINDGRLKSLMDVATLTHFFSPIHEEYGCCAYARQMLFPKGSVTIGKIHRHAHLNFVMKG